MHKTNQTLIKNNKNIFLAALMIGVGIFASASYSQSSGSASTSTITPTTLTHGPLHAARTSDKPAISLALSVEFPTIGALYRDGKQTTDSSYSPSTEYIGYFYSKGCYNYIANPTETPAAGETASQYKRFQFHSESETRTCTGERFSGNFLNWAASSSIDILRLALSGGDRIIDRDGLTILQRAVVPAGTPQVACLWNHGQFFPAKKVPKAHVAGAVPQSLANKLGSNDHLWVSSKHEGLYFNKYSGTNTPTIRAWNDSCNISTEETNYKNFLKGAGNTSNPTINSDGFYYARVEVCTKHTDGAVHDHKDFNLCTLQPSGNYKPTGVIQKHANNLRISAFSYTLDHSSSRYGGVLRAPMRYVGPKSYDIYGREQATPNPYTEWDPNTGILYKNPYGTLDAAIASAPTGGIQNSGVINYLNKFGRLGTTVATGATADNATSHYYGEYKRNDPISSLYHQTLRYLQGLNNIADASSSLIDKHYDGFPIYTNWSNLDPYGDGRSNAENYACLKSNIVAIGDIYSQENSGWKSVNSDPQSRKNINFSTWRDKALTYEKNNFNNNLTAKEEHKIIGYAYWAHANDIRGTDWTENPDKQRPGLRVKTFIFDVNEKGDSTELNTRRKTNQFYLASKYGGYENDPNNLDKNYYSTDERPDWGYDPKDTSSAKTLLKKNAIWERRPIEEKDETTKIYDASTYYLQSDARSVLKAFDDIFNRTAAEAQTISQSASSTNSINATTDSHVYTATYDMASFTGNIVAKKIILNSTTKDITLIEDKNWNPATRLSNRDSNNRNIVIGLEDNAGAADFKWTALSNTTAQALLSKSSPSAQPDQHGEARVEFLRGARTEEGRLFRTRKSLLGDIINAGVTYSGAPSKNLSGKSYELFLAKNKNRLPVVITGANDGMLHVFAAETKSSIHAADEVFAYIPSWMTPKLASLADNNYVINHQSYVDAPSVVGEAQVVFTEGNGSADDWKTFLVSGTGAGGRGVFALDITDPTQFDADKLVWEFTHHNDADMGYVVGKPKILKFKTGVNTYRWFATVASGVNNYSSTYDSNGGSGTPTIFLLALDKPSGEEWTHGTNYFKINLPVDTSVASSQAPGIVDFSMLWGTDGEVTHIYAGDLHGNLWKLDFTDANTTSKYKSTSDWNINKLSTFKKGTPVEALPMYQAVRTTGTGANARTFRQPISAAPLLVTGPVTGGIETFYVLFGTGKYLENSDISNTNIQSFYALFDNGESSSDSTSSTKKSAITAGTSMLAQGIIDTTNKTISIPSFIWGRPKSNTDAVTKKSGWYFDFPMLAERVVYPAVEFGTMNLSFNSIIPSADQVNQSICSSDSASSNVYEFNLLNGTGKYYTSRIGILGPSLFLTNEEKTKNSNFDSTGRAKRTTVVEQIEKSPSSENIRSNSLVEIIGRLSWRQIYNYREIKHSLTTNSEKEIAEKSEKNP